MKYFKWPMLQRYISRVLSSVWMLCYCVDFCTVCSPYCMSVWISFYCIKHVDTEHTATSIIIYYFKTIIILLLTHLLSFIYSFPYPSCPILVSMYIINTYSVLFPHSLVSKKSFFLLTVSLLQVRPLFLLSLMDLLLAVSWLCGALLFSSSCDSHATCYNLHTVEQVNINNNPETYHHQHKAALVTWCDYIHQATLYYPIHIL